MPNLGRALTVAEYDHLFQLDRADAARSSGLLVGPLPRVGPPVYCLGAHAIADEEAYHAQMLKHLGLG